MYKGQPEQEGTGYTDAQLKQFAEQAGVTGAGLTAWQKCYDARDHNQYVESVQTQSEKDGGQRHPDPQAQRHGHGPAGPHPPVLRRQVKAATK